MSTLRQKGNVPGKTPKAAPRPQLSLVPVPAPPPAKAPPHIPQPSHKPSLPKLIKPAFDLLSDVLSWGVSALLPPRCSCCGTPTDTSGRLCPTCWRDITFITEPCCPITGTPFPYTPGNKIGDKTGDKILSAQAFASPPVYDRARAAITFSGTGRRFIHDFKYHDRTEKATLAAQWMSQAGEALLQDSDILVPVPMHWRRLAWRKFNQAAELARALHHHTGLPYAPDLLWRTRHTRPQVEMRSAQERQRNIQGAFTVNARWRTHIPKLRILLIDDVMTTGATIQNCARLLRKAHAPRINVLTLARSDTPQIHRMK